MTEAPAAGEFRYQGEELALFEKAINWKDYWRSQISDFVGGDVLEVGAGIGTNTRLLSKLPYRNWICLEPDAQLIRQIELPSCGRCKIKLGSIEDLTREQRFDTILYIDVLEHIRDDRLELLRAKSRLRHGGNLIVLSPALPFLYSPFDRAIGHFRRYTRASLRATAPAGLEELRMVYLDAVGLLASAGNRLLLNSEMPNTKQILLWDRLLVPVSRTIDRWLGWRVGKTVIGIWRLPN
jgi:SAM-dependent methyltransferase